MAEVVALDTSGLGVLETFHHLSAIEESSFAPVKDRGVDAVGYNSDRFIALQIKTSKRYSDRYLPRGALWSYWWEVSRKLHRKLLHRKVYYIFVGIHFDQGERNAIDRDFFIINAMELEKLFADGGFKYDNKNGKWRIEIYLDRNSRQFLSYHNSNCNLSQYHNAWEKLIEQ